MARTQPVAGQCRGRELAWVMRAVGRNLSEAWYLGSLLSRECKLAFCCRVGTNERFPQHFPKQKYSLKVCLNAHHNVFLISVSLQLIHWQKLDYVHSLLGPVSSVKGCEGPGFRVRFGRGGTG